MASAEVGGYTPTPHTSACPGSDPYSFHVNTDLIPKGTDMKCIFVCMDVLLYVVQHQGQVRIVCAHIKEQALFHNDNTLDWIHVFT